MPVHEDGCGGSWQRHRSDTLHVGGTTYDWKPLDSEGNGGERGDPTEAAYWFNNAPSNRQKKYPVPRSSNLVISKSSSHSKDRKTTVKMEDVWVKPPNPQCTS